MERVAFVTEPLLSSDFVQFQVAVPLLERLARHFDLGLTAPALSQSVRETLESRGIHALGGTARAPPLRHSRDELPSYVWSWARDAFLGQNAREINRTLREFGGLRVNYSMTTACDADCWYIQSGTLGPALQAMQGSFNRRLRWPVRLTATAIGAADWTHAWRAAKHARRIYSSTHHVGWAFGERSIAVRGVVPFYYRSVFRPSTRNPSRDFLLSYLGKETDVEALLQLAKLGVPLKIFGSKSPGWVDSAFRGQLPAHVELLGRLSDEELRDIYSNALLTVFPFTEEPFGLVPVESMACGTPVLSYRKQGPQETIVEGRTGWLVDSPAELIGAARRIFRKGYSPIVTDRCLERAQDFHVDTLAQQWEGLLRAAISDDPEPGYVQRLAERPHAARGAGPILRPQPHLVGVWVEPLGPPTNFDLLGLEGTRWTARHPPAIRIPTFGPTGLPDSPNAGALSSEAPERLDLAQAETAKRTPAP